MQTVLFSLLKHQAETCVNRNKLSITNLNTFAHKINERSTLFFTKAPPAPVIQLPTTETIASSSFSTSRCT